MLSCLSALKSRLAIPDLTVDFDDLLTTALTALSARFDSETNRALSRTVNFPPRIRRHRNGNHPTATARPLWARTPRSGSPRLLLQALPKSVK
jgi:hypothetical protein